MFAKLFLLLSACLPFTASAGEEWVRIQGHVQHVSAKGKELWAVRAGVGHAMRWVDGNWEILTHATRVAATNKNAGYRMLGFLNDFCGYSILDKKWTFCNGGLWLHSISAIDEYALTVNHEGKIHKWTGGWTHMPAPFFATHAAVGDGGEIWAIEANGLVYTWSGEKWKLMPGSGTYIDVQSPKRIVLTGDSYNIFMWENSDWKQVETPEGYGCQQASINYETIYCVTPQNQLWSLNTTTIQRSRK